MAALIEIAYIFLVGVAKIALAFFLAIGIFAAVIVCLAFIFCYGMKMEDE